MQIYTNAQIQSAKIIYDFFLKEKSCRDFQAAAWVGNFDGEASLLPRSAGDKVNGKPTAFGLAEWHDTRVAAILAGTGINIHTADVHQQCEAVYWEITKGSYHTVWQRFIETETVEDAVAVIVKYFEQSGNQPRDDVRRTGYAHYWLSQFGQPANKTLFLHTATPYTPFAFGHYFAGLDFKKASWAPKGLVLHNSAIPTIADWVAGGTSAEQRMINLRHMYRDVDHWHSGPHLFISPEGLIWVLCDPLENGVHCSCANSHFFGVEMIGDFDHEPFDSGHGAVVRDTAMSALSIIFHKMGWTPDPFVPWEKGLGFHRDCVRDHHACPGKLVQRADVVARVNKGITALRGEA